MKKILLTLALFTIVHSSTFAAKEEINTVNAPLPIGTYSQAIKVDNTVYLSGQIAMDPTTGELVSDEFTQQVEQVFKNIEQVVIAAGGKLDDITKLTIYLSDLSYFSQVNEAMAPLFSKPYPARAAIEIKALPKGAKVEIEAVMTLEESKKK